MERVVENLEDALSVFKERLYDSESEDRFWESISYPSHANEKGRCTYMTVWYILFINDLGVKVRCGRMLMEGYDLFKIYPIKTNRQPFGNALDSRAQTKDATSGEFWPISLLHAKRGKPSAFSNAIFLIISMYDKIIIKGLIRSCGR